MDGMRKGDGEGGVPVTEEYPPTSFRMAIAGRAALDRRPDDFCIILLCAELRAAGCIYNQSTLTACSLSLHQS